jgi:6-phosphogluconolactonase (cycloisomerase 2 family)
MRVTQRLAGAALATLAAGALALGATPALAAGTNRALFVQTDNVEGNAIVAYDRGPDGTLTEASTYPTGGKGGKLEGSVVDHLASQGGLAYDAGNRLLYAVNAGSNTISVFAVFGDRLALRQVLSSGGSFPVSIAVHDDTVYVLNALGGGELEGFAVSGGRLVPIPGSERALGLDPAALPQFTHTPGQVIFTPSGTQLLVTTKANGNDVDVFAVSPAGTLSASPTVNPLPGTVPFAATFDKQGHVVLSESAGALASFQLTEGGQLEQLDVVESHQAATCWVVRARGRFYTSNPGSSSLSAFDPSNGGQLLTKLGDTTTDAGTVDAAVPPGGRYLYVQAGAAGIVDEFAVAADGSLTEIGAVTVPGAVGGEGIAAA